MPDQSSQGRVEAGLKAAKAEGAMLALAAGDALGWPQEFPAKLRGPKLAPSATLRTWGRRSGTRFAPYDEEIRAGTYTDDTQLALAVGRSVLAGRNDWWSVFTRVELPLWDIYKIGGGRGTKRAVKSWIKGTAPWLARDEEALRQYFGHGGNGVAMRVLPHAIWRAGEAAPDSLMREVVMDGTATHGHPRALIGATVYALAAWWLLRTGSAVEGRDLVGFLRDHQHVWGRLPSGTALDDGWLNAANRATDDGYERTWLATRDEMQGLLAKVCAQPTGDPKADLSVLGSIGALGPEKGSGTVSTAAALYLCSKYSTEPESAVVGAAFAIGADTDTIGAMVGGLSGGLAGLDRLPDDWLSVQDSEYLRRLARELAAGPDQPPRGRVGARRGVGKRDLDEVIEKIMTGQSRAIDLDGVRSARVARPLQLTDRSQTTVTVGWELSTSDGQTLYFTKQRRRRPAATG